MQKHTWLRMGTTVGLIGVLWFGCHHADNTQQVTTVRIGALLPLSGDVALYGNNTREGILVGVEKANESLQPDGKRLEVVFEDSKANPKDGVSGVQKLIDIDKVSAIIDDSVSGVTLAVAPICDRANVVLLSTGATSPKLSGISKYFFRIWNSDYEEGRFSADFVARKLKAGNVAVLYINNEYGEGLRQVFASAFPTTNTSIVAVESFPQGATDVRAQLVKIAASKPDVVYLVAYSKEAKLVLRQARELALQTTWVGTVVMLEEDMPKLLSELSYVMYFPAPVQPDETSTPVSEFRDRFRRTYKKGPPPLADVGYDAVVLLGKALSGHAVNDSSIQKALATLPLLQMASGEIQFDENGDVHKPMEMRKIP